MKIDLLNKTFGILTVIAEGESCKKGAAQWLCLCECGNKKIIKSYFLRKGITKSCGCRKYSNSALNMKKAHENNKKFTPTEASARVVFKKQYSDGDLTFEQFFSLSQQKCFYCGILPQNKINVFSYHPASSIESIENGTFIYNGLDRINSSISHNINNVVPCCKTCNYSKGNLSIDEFFQYLKRLKAVYGKTKGTE